METVTENRTINFTGKTVIREHCPLTGRKCCCERHICKARKYRRIPFDRRQADLRPPTLGVPNARFEGESSQKASYIPLRSKKLDIIKPLHGLHLKVGNFEKITTHTSAFPKYLDAQRTYPIQPCRRQIWGTGPLQDTTNQKDDYGFKPYSKRETFTIKSNLFCNDKPFDDRTTIKLSFGPPENFIPRKNLRPPGFFTKECVPMLDTTTHKSSYIELKPAAKIDLSSWNGKVPYLKPTVPMSGITMYKQSYLPKDSMHKPAVPFKKFDKCDTISGDKSFYDTTIYADSFAAKKLSPEDEIRREPIKTSIHFGNDRFDGTTVNGLTYIPWVAEPSVPKTIDCSSSLRKLGPMDLLTTHQRDFQSKPYSKRSSKTIAKTNTFTAHRVPLDCRTTSGISYPQPNTKMKRPRLVRPLPVICPSNEKFDGDTMYKQSFTPWLLPKREPYLSSPDKFMGIHTTGTVSKSTTYRNSYQMPEKIVEDDCEKPCGCLYPTQCLDI